MGGVPMVALVKFPRSIVPKDYAVSILVKNALQGICYLLDIHLFCALG